MKRIVALVAAAVILGLLWCLLLPVTRPAQAPVSPPTDLQAYEPASEVQPVEQPPSSSNREPDGGIVLLEEQPGPRSAIVPGRRAAPARAPVRGHLRVAETGDPIHEVLSLRLRTLDLEHKEDLLTLRDGSFTSMTSYSVGALLAQVKDRDGRELVDHEAAFDPSSAEPWDVPIPCSEYPTFVRGTVVDLQGSPLDEVSVRIDPLESPSPSSDEDPLVWNDEGSSDENGRFELKVRGSGNYRLQLQGIWQSRSLELLLQTGPNELGPLVLNETRSAGLLVRFVCEDDTAQPLALIAVRPATLPGELVLYSCPIVPIGVRHPRWYLNAEERGSGNFELRLPRLPSGTCTLKIEGLDGRAYVPGLAVVDVPGTLEVRVSGKQRSMKALRALDAETGKPIPRFQAWMRCHGVWGLRESEDGHLFLCGADAWAVLSEKYRGVRGTDVPDEYGILDVRLEPGSWSALLVFEEAAGDTSDNLDFGRNRRLLAGVEVLADGRSVGKSDDDGMLLLSSDSRPRELAFRLEGWHIAEESDSDSVPRSGSFHEVWMLRDR